MVTVVEEPDETLLMGDSGMTGSSMSPAAFEELQDSLRSRGERIVADTASELGLTGAETKILFGHPGDAICDFAETVGAGVIVIGSRGRGGIRRALFGSVSDFVVRNAPCPVLVSRSA